MTETIGRYEIISEIGKGGMGTVYKAHDPNLNQDRAIKILSAELLSDPTFRTRFDREAKTIAVLEHPSIVPIYDYGEANLQPYIVMRLMTGGSLADRIRAGALSVADSARILTRIASALDEAHSKGIVHRDLKPGNILFDDRNQAYLSDFGIVKLSKAEVTLTKSGIVGTPAYMSPEQAMGETELDGRSDIYSLGVTLFEMLSGRVPFQADTPVQQILMQINVPTPNILELRPDLPLDCQAILEQAMAKRKFMRYTTAGEMAQAFSDMAEGKLLAVDSQMPTIYSSGGQKTSPAQEVGEGGSKRTPPPGVSHSGSTPPPRGRSTPLPGRRSGSTPPPGYTGGATSQKPITPIKIQEQEKPKSGKLAVGIFSAAFVIILIVIAGISAPRIISWLSAKTPTLTPTIAMTETFPALEFTATEELAVVIPTQTEAPTITPVPTDTPLPMSTIEPTQAFTGPVIGGADMLAFVHNNEIWVSYMDGTHLQQLTNSGGSKGSLQWTPDGKAITYIQGKAVEMVNLETRKVDMIFNSNWADYLAGFEISPDGEQVAISLSDGLFVLDYNLQRLKSIKRQDDLQTAGSCLKSPIPGPRQVRWGSDSQTMAVVVSVTTGLSQKQVVRVYNIAQCGQAPINMGEFPQEDFTINGYGNNPVIENLGWDGDKVFAVNASRLNGYGDFYTYNLASKTNQMINPINNHCCYRDFRWSPDWEYLFFVYEDIDQASSYQFYLVSFGNMAAGKTYTPIAFPEGFFSNPREKPQPVMRKHQ